MLADAFLSVMTATEPPPEPASGLIPLTRNEIRRLLTAAFTCLVGGFREHGCPAT
jgi:hypothetical protein